MIVQMKDNRQRGTEKRLKGTTHTLLVQLYNFHFTFTYPSLSSYFILNPIVFDFFYIKKRNSTRLILICYKTIP